ncbi:MAG: type I-E CRISPR-associated protein Cas7/Cse4/CasC [Chloroflexota bacterium]|nr:MAG: type I-E CRISPR-associated protein Cas7/Cse4/CasC [Chloroflexota bacterium]
MFVELHILQNFPPSNLNRDDVGQPKSTDFGGTTRARISSQCLKRQIRFAGKDPKDKKTQSVFERYTQVPLADRTKLIVQELTQRLEEKKRDKQQAEMFAKVFAELYAGGMDSKNANKTNVLLYLSDQEQARVASELDKHWDALVAATAPETPLTGIAKQFADKINQRAGEPAKDQAIRANNLAKELQARLEKNGKGKDAKAVAGEFKKGFKGEAKTFTAAELDWVSAEIDVQWDAIQASRKAESPLQPIVNELINETKDRTSAPDIALFGRMLADKPETNIDAACQVAHAISTHTVGRNELDYFTAMDDLQTKGESGAGHLDVAYFNSACFYRYARIDVKQLKKNLGDDALAYRTVEAFLRASEAAIPSGKKNSHAQEVRPSFMLAALRDDDSAGWSLVNAFETPTRANSEAGLLKQSVLALNEHFNQLSGFYDEDTKRVLAVAIPSGAIAKEELSDELKNAVKPKMSEWVNAIVEPLEKGAMP